MSRFASSGWPAGASAAGTWRLLPGQALTLQPRRGGVLRVAAGALWATADGPHGGPSNGRGDRVLEVGETVSLRAGERLVVEPIGGVAPARFAWDPLPPWPARRASVPALLWRVLLLMPASVYGGDLVRCGVGAGSPPR
ncbi:MAG TPA: DUF2917 domain-containing protein [Ramlibacter sp.]|nr:DUF2917 domain-containing protein [Ramlibacter sp.]